MSLTLEDLQDYAWTAHAAVNQCKTLEVALMDKGSTAIIDMAEELINEVLWCEGEAKCKLLTVHLKALITVAHEYWNDCVRKSWGSLKPKLDTLVENQCEHGEPTECTCKLERRMTLYGFLWADFFGPSASENTKHRDVAKMALDTTIMVIDAIINNAEGEDQSHLLQAISKGDKRMLMLLESFKKPHRHVAYWHGLFQRLITYNPIYLDLNTLQKRHAYEVIPEPGVAAVDA